MVVSGMIFQGKIRARMVILNLTVHSEDGEEAAMTVPKPTGSHEIGDFAWTPPRISIKLPFCGIWPLTSMVISRQIVDFRAPSL